MIEAFASWGSFDLDDPFPLFAEARELGAVHPVTLADGHDAWLVVRFDEAMTALNDPRLSKDMDAAWRRVRKSSPRGCRGRILPGTCSPWTRRTTPGFVDSSLLPSPPSASRPCVHGSRPSPTISSMRSRTGVQATVSTSSQPLRSPCHSRSSANSWVYRRRTGLDLARVHPAARPDLDSFRVRRGQGRLGCGRGDARDLVAGKETSPGDDLVSALIRARDGDDSLDSRELLSSIFQLMVAGHDTTASLIGNSVVALLRNPSSSRSSASDPETIAAAVEISSAMTRRFRIRPSATPSSRSLLATRRSRKERR